MEIIKTAKDETTELSLIGRLDTTTAPELEEELKKLFEEGSKDLVIDLEQLEYISSAGLRVLLSAHKTMAKQGNMRLLHANEVVMEVFEVTGFVDILNIE